VILVGAAVVLLLFLVGYPLLWLILAAFGLPGELSLQHILRAFTRPQNYSALINTLQLAFGAGVMSVLIGVPLAWATARTDMKFRNAVHALVALSYITPPYLTALAYTILLGPDAGRFNRVLRLFVDVDSGPINIFTMGGIIFVIGIHVFAFTYFLTYNALCSVDASFEESAQILGARRWQTTLRVNLPLVAPAITGGALLSAIDSLALFGPGMSDASNYAHILVGRLYLTLGNPRAALTAFRRRTYMTGWPRYLATVRREEALVAVTLGDTAIARGNFARYLAIRRRPEPALLAAVNEVRKQARALSSRTAAILTPSAASSRAT